MRRLTDLNQDVIIKKITDFEKAHCKRNILEYNSVCESVGSWDYGIDPSRSEHGYHELNCIVYNISNALLHDFGSESAIYKAFNKFIYVPTMDWQNGVLKF